MYIRNIIKAINNMADGEEIIVGFRSGKTSKILKTDKYENINGDLVITRELDFMGRCVLYIDPAEVESIIIHKEEKL